MAVSCENAVLLGGADDLEQMMLSDASEEPFQTDLAAIPQNPENMKAPMNETLEKSEVRKLPGLHEDVMDRISCLPRDPSRHPSSSAPTLLDPTLGSSLHPQDHALARQSRPPPSNWTVPWPRRLLIGPRSWRETPSW